MTLGENGTGFASFDHSLLIVVCIVVACDRGRNEWMVVVDGYPPDDFINSCSRWACRVADDFCVKAGKVLRVCDL